MTADTTRPVRGYFWSRDGKYILYVQDKGGDENWHIYAVDPQAKLEPGQDVPPPRDLTPVREGGGDDIRAAEEHARRHLRRPQRPRRALPRRVPARYRDGRADAREAERQTRSRAGYSTSQGNLRLASKQTADGGTEILRVDPDTMVVVYSCSKDETVDPIRFHKDGKRVYMAIGQGRGRESSSVSFSSIRRRARKSSSRPIPRIRSISAAPSSRRKRTSSSRPTTSGTGSASISGTRNGRRTTSVSRSSFPTATSISAPRRATSACGSSASRATSIRGRPISTRARRARPSSCTGRIRIFPRRISPR